MSKIKGITVILIDLQQTGEDAFRHPVFEEIRTPVPNVIVSPVGTQDIADTLNLIGKKAEYNIAIPKKDTHDWKDKKVEFFGRVWQVIGFPKRGMEENIPLDWNDIWMVAAYE